MRRIVVRGTGCRADHGGRGEQWPNDLRTDRHDAGDQPTPAEGVRHRAQNYPLGKAQAQEGSMTVFVYVNTSKQVGDPDHLKVFANADAAETWFEENDPRRRRVRI